MKISDFRFKISLAAICILQSAICNLLAAPQTVYVNPDGTLVNTTDFKYAPGKLWSGPFTVDSLLAGKQPLDPDLTAIAALTTTAYGRGLLALADGPAVISYLGRTTIAGYGITDFNLLGDARWPQLSGSYVNPSWIVSLPFSKLTSTPTTIAGYGITDFNSLGDARWSLLAHTHTFASLTSKPTTIAGFGITDFNSLGDARWQPLDSDLTTWAGITPTAGIGTFLATPTLVNLKAAVTDETTAGWNLLTLANPSAITFLKIAADNSVTAESAATHRTSLGLVIGTNVQAWDADLDTYAGITPSANAQTLLGHTFSQMRTDLGLVIGTNVQAWDADLDTWATITPASGIGTFLATPTLVNLKAAVTDETTAGWNLLTIANPGAITFLKIAADNSVSTESASTHRTSLGLVIGTNVQAWDADLDTWATITPASGVGTFLVTPSSANLLAALTSKTGTGNAVFGTSPTISGTSTSITNIGTFALRDTSAAFDLTITATSGTALSAARTLTVDVGNVAHTLVFGTTANTITFPNAASGTVPFLNLAQTWTALQSFGTNLGGTLQTAAQANVTSLGTLTGLTVSAKPDFQVNAAAMASALRVSNLDGSGNGPQIEYYTGYGTKVVATTGAQATGASGSTFFLQTLVGGSLTTILTASVGLQVGAPTGGDKGAGTANFAGDIYKNNAAYTNPDYVLEKWATGEIVRFADNDGAAAYDRLRPIEDVEAFVRSEFVLPRIAEFRARDEHGLFAGSDAMLATLEEAYLYIFDLEHRLKATEEKMTNLEARLAALEAE